MFRVTLSKEEEGDEERRSSKGNEEECELYIPGQPKTGENKLKGSSWPLLEDQ